MKGFMSPFTPILEAFNRQAISYVVVGGVATVLHGHARFTGDVDCVIELSASNIERVLMALTNLGFVPRLPVDPTEKG
jgi:Nucleotidyltransferase of unknown function (DUF6036)